MDEKLPALSEDLELKQLREAHQLWKEDAEGVRLMGELIPVLRQRIEELTEALEVAAPYTIGCSRPAEAQVYAALGRPVGTRREEDE